MPAQVPDEIKADRNARLLAVTGRLAAARSARLLGRTVDVLVDGRSRKDAEVLAGRTRCNRVVNFDGQGQVAVGDVVPLTVTEVLPHSLRATLAPHAEDALCTSR